MLHNSNVWRRAAISATLNEKPWYCQRKMATKAPGGIISCSAGSYNARCHQLRPFQRTSAPTYTEKGGEHSHSSCRFNNIECRYSVVCRQKLKNSKHPQSRQIHTAAGQHEEEDDFPEYSNLIGRITTPLGDNQVTHEVCSLKN